MNRSRFRAGAISGPILVNRNRAGAISGPILVNRCEMAERRIYYGGQAVIEGVMIRGPSSMAIACRKPNGQIIVSGQTLGGAYTGPLRRLPLVRGVIVMWETLALGIRGLVF